SGKAERTAAVQVILNSDVINQESISEFTTTTDDEDDEFDTTPENTEPADSVHSISDSEASSSRSESWMSPGNLGLSPTLNKEALQISKHLDKRLQQQDRRMDQLFSRHNNELRELREDMKRRDDRLYNLVKKMDGISKWWRMNLKT
ncbi:hypothetical protein BGX26_006642, partial [Mortierella sp. AD094]